MDTKQVRKTVQDLLRLAGNDGATSGEIDAAMAAVARIMAKYQLSSEDLEQKDEIIDELKNAEFVRREVKLGSKSVTLWESSAAHFVCEMVAGTKYYQRTSDKDMKGLPTFLGECSFFVFYGVKDDVRLAVELYSELNTTIQVMARVRYSGAYRGAGRNYCEGFTNGLRNKLQLENKKQEAETRSTNALMVIARNQIVERKQNLSEDFLKAQGIFLKTGKAFIVNVTDKAAFHAGFKDGQNYTVKPDRAKIR